VTKSDGTVLNPPSDLGIGACELMRERGFCAR
jgi:hypothetical protein